MKRNVVCIDYSDYLEETLKISETLNKLGDFKLISNYKVHSITNISMNKIAYFIS